MTDITPAEFIDRVSAELNNRGWTPRGGDPDTGAICVYGAIHHAERALYGVRPHYDYSVTRALRGLRAVARAMNPNEPMPITTDPVIYYNYHIANSIEDIQLLLKHARESLEADQ